MLSALLLASVIALLLTASASRASAAVEPRYDRVPPTAPASPGAASPTANPKPHATHTGSSAATSSAKPTPTATKTPVPVRPPAGHRSNLPLRVAVVVVLVALAALLWILLRRSGGRRGPDRRLAAATPARAPTSMALPAAQHNVVPSPVTAGPLRPATVWTELHPQGYVDVDRCLRRAEWAAADEPPPAPGSLVVVARPGAESMDPEVLLAFPPDPRGRPHAP